MRNIKLNDGAVMIFQVDDFTDPWREPETVLFVHGNAESGRAWYGWVPHFSRQYRVLRPDMRGFGESTPMELDFAWSLKGLAEDFVVLLDHMKLERVHVVAAKIGCFAATTLAAAYPERVNTLTLVGAPVYAKTLAVSGPSVQIVRDSGVEAWARVNMHERLGSAMPSEAAEWWTSYMGQTAASTQIGFIQSVATFDVENDLPRVLAPTLVLTSEKSAIATVAGTRKWQTKIPRSELRMISGDSYHIAVSHADECARHTLDFIRQRGNRHVDA